jgi:hypothetical protein
MLVVAVDIMKVIRQDQKVELVAAAMVVTQATQQAQEQQIVVVAVVAKTQLTTARVVVLELSYLNIQQQQEQ